MQTTTSAGRVRASPHRNVASRPVQRPASSSRTPSLSRRPPHHPGGARRRHARGGGIVPAHRQPRRRTARPSSHADGLVVRHRPPRARRQVLDRRPTHATSRLWIADRSGGSTAATSSRRTNSASPLAASRPANAARPGPLASTSQTTGHRNLQNPRLTLRSRCAWPLLARRSRSDIWWIDICSEVTTARSSRRRSLSARDCERCRSGGLRYGW